MSKKINSQIILTIIVLLLLDVALLFSYAWLSFFIRAEAGNAKSVAVSAALLRADAERLLSDQKFWDGSAPERAKMLDSIATPKRLANFFELAESLARESGIDAKISQAGFVKVADRTGVDVEVKAEGGFSNLMQYTALLERMPYQYSILKSQFTGEGGKWSASYTLRISGYDEIEL